MATVRITHTIRNEILDEKIPELFSKRMTEHDAAFPVANAVACIKTQMQDFIEKTKHLSPRDMDAYFKHNKEVKITCEFEYTNPFRDNYVSNKQSSRTITLASDLHAPYETQALGSCFGYAYGSSVIFDFKPPVGSLYYEEVKAFFTKTYDLIEERDSMRRSVEKILDACVTIRQFLRAWPQGESLIPQEALNRHYAKVESKSRSDIDIEIDSNLSASLLKAKIQT